MMNGDEYHNAKQNIDVNEMMKMKTLRGMDDNFTSTKASKQQHDDVDVVPFRFTQYGVSVSSNRIILLFLLYIRLQEEISFNKYTILSQWDIYNIKV